MYQQILDIATNKPSTHTIRRVSDGAFIPVNEQNADYQAYLKWQAEGNKLLPVGSE